MENKKAIENKNIDIIEFTKATSHILSPYFNLLFENNIKKITIEKQTKKQTIMTYEVYIDKKSSNPLGIAHGGAIATLFENLTNLSILYLGKNRYRTQDIVINYKNHVDLDITVLIKINIHKLNYPTTFINAELIKEGEVCSSASIIKTKIDPKF
jgi:acyl-coenzyme A thioesterase PaaI-like protein